MINRKMFVRPVFKKRVRRFHQKIARISNEHKFVFHQKRLILF